MGCLSRKVRCQAPVPLSSGRENEETKVRGIPRGPCYSKESFADIPLIIKYSWELLFYKATITALAIHTLTVDYLNWKIRVFLMSKCVTNFNVMPSDSKEKSSTRRCGWAGRKAVSEFVAFLGKVFQTIRVCSQDRDCIVLDENQDIREADRSGHRGLSPQ